MKTKVQNDRGESIIFELRGDQVFGQWFHSSGAKMSDGQIHIHFSWTHGTPNEENFQDIVGEHLITKCWDTWTTVYPDPYA